MEHSLFSCHLKFLRHFEVFNFYVIRSNLRFIEHETVFPYTIALPLYPGKALCAVDIFLAFFSRSLIYRRQQIIFIFIYQYNYPRSFHNVRILNTFNNIFTLLKIFHLIFVVNFWKKNFIYFYLFVSSF
jgi:hypothetical protein